MSYSFRKNEHNNISLDLEKNITKVRPGILSKHLSQVKDNNDRLKEEIDRLVRASSKHNLDSSGLKFTKASFQITINSFSLSQLCLHYLAQKFGDDVEVCLKWTFMKFAETSTPLEKVVEATGKIVAFTEIYQLPFTSYSINFLKDYHMVIDLYASDSNHQEKIGTGKANFSKALINPHVTHVSYVEVYNGEGPEEDNLFCLIKMMYQLNCDTSRLSNYMTGIEKMKKQEADSDYTLYSTLGGLGLSMREVRMFQEALDLVKTRNNALKTTQAEISSELRDRAIWLHEECNWKRTLQEFAILQGKNPNSVKWRQWRDELSSKIQMRNYPNKPVNYKQELVIELKKLSLYSHTSLMDNDKIDKVYLEYTFLDYEGIEMESEVSLPKFGALNFNFVKSFPIDPEENDDDCKILAEMVKNKKTVEVVVVGEPKFDKRLPIQVCEEVGRCNFSIFDIVQSIENENSFWFEVWSWKNPDELIGKLKIRFQGLLALRGTVLQILAPASYQMIE